ncbi:MAG: response regulator transcription factor [Chloroflexi bacterium]|nr:response regulator transcription factor [Chloroflexota bacterium]
MIRIILCDDQEIVTEGMTLILSVVADFSVVGVARDGAEAVTLAAKLKPDIILMDLRMPILNGIQATRQLHTHFPEIRVLVLTTYDDDAWVFDAIRAGAAGYLLKDTPREHIIAAIRGTVAGATYVDPKVAAKLFAHVAHPSPTAKAHDHIAIDLSEREREILKLLTDGLNNTDIAEHLHLSKGTVQNYISNLFVKLEVTDRTQAALLALRYGLVE